MTCSDKKCDKWWPVYGMIIKRNSTVAITSNPKNAQQNMRICVFSPHNFFSWLSMCWRVHILMLVNVVKTNIGSNPKVRVPAMWQGLTCVTNTWPFYAQRNEMVYQDLWYQGWRGWFHVDGYRDWVLTCNRVFLNVQLTLEDKPRESARRAQLTLQRGVRNGTWRS